MEDEKFGIDIDSLLLRLVPDRSDPAFAKLDAIRMKLVEMHKQNIVKINHSAMEVICAKHLISKGCLLYTSDAADE